MRLTKANAQINTLWSDLPICLTITLILSLSCLPTTWALSDKRLCADEKCEQIISLGSAKINYASGEEGMLSFKIHSPVRILSKSAGSNMKLWGVEINGRRGYANKDFIMEKKILISDKDLKHEVPVPQKSLPTASAPVVNNPTQAEPKPKADTQPSQEQSQVVLNASETADDISTTTTSPLDTLKLGILTEQDQLGSNEASTPINPVPANLQVVDGTELPLEAVPATTERVLNLTKPDAEKKKTEETPTTTSGSDEFDDYEEDEDDDDVYNDDDDDEDATLDSKDNDLANDKKAPNVEESKSNLASKGTPEEAATERSTIPTPATPATIQVEPEGIPANDKTTQQAEVQTISDKVPENVATVAPPRAEGNISNEAKAVPVISEEVKNETATEQPKEENVPKQSAAELQNKVEEKVEIDASKEPTQVLAVETNDPETNVKVEPLKLIADPNDETKPLSMETQPMEPAKDSVPASSETEVNAASTEATKVETSAQAENVEGSSVKPTTDTLPPATLPPLFNKQNFDNPNDYYKQLQEQQLNQKEEQKQQHQKQLEQEQQQREEKEQQERELKQQKEQQEREQKEKQAQQQREEKEQQERELKQQQEQQQREQREKQEQQEQEQKKQRELLEQQQREVLEQQQRELLEQQQREAEQQQKREKLEQEQREQHEREKLEQQQREKEEQQRREAEQQTTTPTSFDANDAIYHAEVTAAPPVAITSEEVLASGTVEEIRSPAPPPVDTIKEDVAAGPGLFATIMDTVNSFISNQGQKEPEAAPLTGNDELHRLLYPEQAARVADVNQPEGYCNRPMEGNCHATITLDNFVEVLAAKVLDNSLLLLCVVIAAASSLFFILVYYCFCNSSQEGALLSKLNHLERSLLASHKENLLLKHDLMTTRTKLSSIEDNSFGSNDMVLALKKELETELYEKAKLQEQVSSLEKDLDNAAEAGLELNKMLSEVLNSQNGDEAFMSTVEELQHQLNDQEKIIIEINASLAEKSRENSELQYSYTESTTRLTSEMKSLQQDNYELEMEKAKLQTRIDEIQAETEQELAKALEARNYEMQRLQHQIMELNAKLDKEHSELQTSLAKIEALEECLKQLKKDGNSTNIQELIVSAKTRGELNAAQKKFHGLQTKLEQELASKVRLESQLKASTADVEQLKQDFNQSERDKLEAQTRLEVLSGYFRDKETQLQKELSLQEAKWLQHQGENASTVETQTLMKNEIQTLKSQNDELRAEIEAQIASHKAQMGTLENRAHESWLAARQSERRCEEAQAEAAGLRRRLTAMASGGGGAAAVAAMAAGSDIALDATLPGVNGSILAPHELNSNPSPLPLPLPGSPGLLNMPNALPFLPAFMGLPPPPFLPPAPGAGGARLPPLGRMRSPPPSRGDRYDDRDDRDDYSDYDDYDDEEEDERLMDRHRRHSGSWGRNHRDDYIHSPRTYRSLSPSDSRYNYNETETDYSPPPSPPPPRHSSRPINEV